MPIIQINTSKILVLSRNIPDVQGAALLLLLLQFCLLKLIIKGLTPWTPEVPQWQCLWAMWESQPQKQTDWPPMWRRDVRLCVCDCTMFRYVLNICRASACIPACTCQGGTVKWLCGVRQIFIWLSAITSTAACFSCSISASRIDATVYALH